MKKIFYFMVALATFTASAQVGIGVPTANIDASAQLEVASTTKGFLAPRMTETQKNAITSPAAGLLVYQTDGTSGFYYYDGTTWKQGLGPQGATGAAGAAGVAGQTNTSLLYPSASIYADGAAPTNAPSAVTTTYGNFGWYFKKTGNSKINWYIQPKSSSMKVSDLTGLYLELFNVAITSASDMPYITVYTKATGSGDAASWYKSRRSYTFSGTPATNTKYLGFANLGATSPNSYNNNLLNLVADNILSRGDYASTEDILFIVINSSSVASTCEFVANKLGVITGSGTQEFLFMPPSSVADLSGYATTNALSTEVARAQAAETTLTSSVTALSNTVSQITAPDLSNYVTNNGLTTSLNDLTNLVDLGYVSKYDLTNTLQSIYASKQSVTDLASSLNDKAPIAFPSFIGTATADRFQIPNGSSDQYLMADGTTSSGTTGPKGEKGDMGPQGEMGYPGPQGDKGDMGPQGEMGPAGKNGMDGVPGPQGEIGMMGDKGPQGDKGDMGPQGEMGPAGTPADLSGYATTAALVTVETQVAQSTSDISALSSSLNNKAPIVEPTFAGTATADGFKTPTGTAVQFLKADGSLDSNTYLTAATAGSNFVDVTTAQTIAGSKTFNSDLKVSGLTIGLGAGSQTSNIALGLSVLNANTTGIFNTGAGYGALYQNTTGTYNTAFGVNSLTLNTTGEYNTATGPNSLTHNSSGSNNTATGFQALDTNSTGSNNTAIGYKADVTSDGLTNVTAIGYGAKVDASNKIQLGNAAVTSVNTSATITGAGFKTPQGTSSQYLMADGSVSSAGATADLSGYATTAALVTVETQVAQSTSDISALSTAVSQIATMQAEIAVLKTQIASLLSSNEPPAVVSLAIGDTYQGGKVAYILQSGDPGYDANVQHGLIVATASIGNKSLGDYNTTSTYGTSTNFGSGMNNTNLIAQANPSYDGAAQLAINYTVAQYTDWYLPSEAEGAKIKQNLNMLGFDNWITCMGSSIDEQMMGGGMFSEPGMEPSYIYTNYVMTGLGWGGNNMYWNVGENKDVLPIHNF